MNVALILSGGVGRRFGDMVPKQYQLIGDRQVVAYVIDAVRHAADAVLAVSHREYEGLFRDFYRVDWAEAGEERNRSLKNGLDYIRDHYPCRKVIILDAVRPFVGPALVEEYFGRLADHSAVLTASKITDSLGSYDMHRVDRERFYLLSSPEAYDFDLLYRHFDERSVLTEVAQQLPEGTPTYLNFGFRNNFKITYKNDLLLAYYMLREEGLVLEADIPRLSGYLFRNFPRETAAWYADLKSLIARLQKKWQVGRYTIHEKSHFGIILFADSGLYGRVAVKLIPPFIGRFRGELGMYRLLSPAYMCPLLDYDEAGSALLLRQAVPGTYPDFFSPRDRTLIEDLFREVSVYVRDGGNLPGEITDYTSVLNGKTDALGNLTYEQKRISALVHRAVTLMAEYFGEGKPSLIHGDIHKYNIVFDGTRLLAIDPIGYIAPLEIEYARFIGTLLTDNMDRTGGILEDALEFFSRFTSRERLTAALFIDVVFRMHNSTFEDDNTTLLDKWLSIAVNHLEPLIPSKQA